MAAQGRRSGELQPSAIDELAQAEWLSGYKLVRPGNPPKSLFVQQRGIDCWHWADDTKTEYCRLQQQPTNLLLCDRCRRCPPLEYARGVEVRAPSPQRPISLFTTKATARAFWQSGLSPPVQLWRVRYVPTEFDPPAWIPRGTIFASAVILDEEVEL